MISHLAVIGPLLSTCPLTRAPRRPPPKSGEARSGRYVMNGQPAREPGVVDADLVPAEEVALRFASLREGSSATRALSPRFRCGNRRPERSPLVFSWGT